MIKLVANLLIKHTVKYHRICACEELTDFVGSKIKITTIGIAADSSLTLSN